MTQAIELKDERLWSLSEVVNASGEQLIKVPIAYVWKGQHPEYGEVDFSQNKIDEILHNWENLTAGYEPSLKIGHAKPHRDRFGDDSSEGWPDRLYQEGDTLYGEYRPTDPELIGKVKAKKYRYASAEVLPNAVDKTTGKPVGAVLTGVALTNEPFLPMRHREVEVIEKFSEADPSNPSLLFSFEINKQESIMTTENQPIETPAIEQPQSFAALAIESVSKEQYDELRRKYSEVTEQFSGLAAEHSTLKGQLETLLAKETERDLQQKFAKLNQLNLPAERKQLFAELIQSGDLSADAEKKLFAQYEDESAKYGKLFTTPQGDSEAQPEHKAPQVFAEIIDRNAKATKQRLGLVG
jgi:hypothetical protein